MSNQCWALSKLHFGPPLAAQRMLLLQKDIPSRKNYVSCTYPHAVHRHPSYVKLKITLRPIKSNGLSQIELRAPLPHQTSYLHQLKGHPFSSLFLRWMHQNKLPGWHPGPRSQVSHVVSLHTCSQGLRSGLKTCSADGCRLH